jgi:hypothetical protein
MRALSVIAASESSDQQQPRLTKALDTFYSQHWEHAVATHKPEVLRETLVGLFGEGQAEESEFVPFYSTMACSLLFVELTGVCCFLAEMPSHITIPLPCMHTLSLPSTT